MLLPSLFILGLWAGCLYAIIAVGLVLVKQTSGFVNFSHGATIIIAAYGAYAFMTLVSSNIILGIIVGILAGCTSALFFELIIYKVLRRRGASPLVLMITSLALFIITINTVTIIFKDYTLVLPIEDSKTLIILSTRLTITQIYAMIGSLIIFASLILLSKSPIGLKMRAMANDIELSIIFGINSDSVIIYATILAGITAAIGGFLWATENDINTIMGLRLLLYGLVAATIGEFRGVKGVIVSGLFLGIIQYIGIWQLPSRWQDSIVLVILLIYLLSRPIGFLGRDIRGIKV